MEKMESKTNRYQINERYKRSKSDQPRVSRTMHLCLSLTTNKKNGEENLSAPVVQSVRMEISKLALDPRLTAA